MNTTLLFVQALNGLQFGILLFLVAAGLTLVFGVMDFINLAHGVQYMLGAYMGATFAALTGSFWWGLLLTLPATLAFGLLLEFLVFRHLYDRDHLSQVLATFGVILFLNQGVKAVFGTAPMQMPLPELLSGGVPVMDGLLYPTYRIAILVAGLATAALLWFLVERTRIGMLVRAGASNAPMVSASRCAVRSPKRPVRPRLPNIECQTPSWSVKLITSKLTANCTPASFSVRRHSSPAQIPTAPSYEPEFWVVSKCDPIRNDGAAALWVMTKIPLVLPMASSRSTSPASSTLLANHARASRSSLDSAWRVTPPSGWPPMAASSSKSARNRSALMRRSARLVKIEGSHFSHGVLGQAIICTDRPHIKA